MSATPPISILIPTKGRPAALARTLEALNSQRAADDFEVIVVDNGPDRETRETVEAASGAGGSATVRYLEHAEGGPAGARNAGAAAARGEALLLLGDDTEPASDDLVERHAALHRERPEASFLVLGRITWTPRREATPFMRWLEDGGPQFSYGRISAGEVSAEDHFYSSHLSLKRALFERIGGFDERFPDAAIEDTDLGARLADSGYALTYHPELLVWHDHPTTLADSLARMERVGRSAVTYNRLRPERPHWAVGVPAGPRWGALRAAAPALRLLPAERLPAGARGRLWWALHMDRYASGYRSALRTGAEGRSGSLA